jgi:lysophospholipase L1-like esterase
MIAGMVAIAAAAIVLLLMPADAKHVPAPVAGPDLQQPTKSASFIDAAPPAPVKSTLPHGHTLRLLFVGDSLRAGFFAARKSLSYPELVAKHLRREHHKVAVLDATKIATTGDGFRRVASIKAVPSSADLAVVELGTNDVVKTPLSNFRRDYRHLLSLIRRTSPAARLLCLSVWQGGQSVDPERSPYNAVIASECRTGVYVNITDLALNRGYHGPANRRTFVQTQLSDTFHPNDAGHAAIAAAILERLR